MRLKSFIIPIAAVLIGATAFLSSCSCNKEEPVKPKPEVEKPTVFDFSDADSPESGVEVIEYDYESGMLQITVPEDQVPKVGDIICSGITEEAPYGFLMQVGSVEQVSTKVGSPSYIVIADASVTLYMIFKALEIDVEDLRIPLIASNTAFVDENGNTIYKSDASDGLTTIEVPLTVKTEYGELSLTYTNKISVPSFDFYFDATTPNLKVGFNSIIKSEAVTNVKLEGTLKKKGDMYKEFCDKTGNKDPYIIQTYAFTIGFVPLVVTTKLKPSMPYELSLSGKVDMDIFKKTNYYDIGGCIRTLTMQPSPVHSDGSYCSVLNPDEDFCDYPTRDFSASINGKASWGFDVEYSVGLYGGNLVEESIDELKEIADDFGHKEKLISFSNCKYLSVGANLGFKLEDSFSLGAIDKYDDTTENNWRIIDDSKFESYMYGRIWGTALDVDVEVAGVAETGVKLLTGEAEWKFMKYEYHFPFFFPIMAKMKAGEDTHQHFISITAYRYEPLFSRLFKTFKELDYGYCVESADGQEYEMYSLNGHPVDKDTNKSVFSIPRNINDYRKNVRYYVYPYIKVQDFLLTGVEKTVYRDGIYFIINNEGQLSSSVIEDVPGENL